MLNSKNHIHCQTQVITLLCVSLHCYSSPSSSPLFSSPSPAYTSNSKSKSRILYQEKVKTSKIYSSHKSSAFLISGPSPLQESLSLQYYVLCCCLSDKWDRFRCRNNVWSQSSGPSELTQTQAYKSAVMAFFAVSRNYFIPVSLSVYAQHRAARHPLFIQCCWYCGLLPFIIPTLLYSLPNHYCHCERLTVGLLSNDDQLCDFNALLSPSEWRWMHYTQASGRLCHKNFYQSCIDTILEYFREACSSWNDLQRSLKVIQHCTGWIGQTLLPIVLEWLIMRQCSCRFLAVDGFKIAEMTLRGNSRSSLIT